MIVIPIVIAVAGFATNVACFPATDLAFPEQANGVEAAPSGQDRFRQENHLNPGNYPSFSPQWTDPFRPPSSRPGDTYRPTGSRPEQDPRPPFSRPGGDYRPLRPSGNSRPSTPQRPGQGSQPSFSRPEEDFRPQAFRPNGVFNSQGSAPEYSRPPVSRPVESSRPQVQRPSGNNYRPEGTKPGNVSNPSSFQPDFLTVGSSGSSNQNSGSIGNSGSDQVGYPSLPDAQDSSTEGLEVSTAETTTKIPRRDPTYRIISTSPCPCMFTRQYSPVCGTDGQTYLNIALLQCTQTCGKDVKVILAGSCGRNNGHPGAIDLHYR